MALENYVNVIEASRRLNIHPETVKRLIRQGNLPAVKLGNAWLIEKDKIEIFASTYDPRRGTKKKLI